MPLTVLTTQELVDQSLVRMESALNKTTPANDISYNRVMAIVTGLLGKLLYVYLVDRAKQNLAMTATDGLETIGYEVGVDRYPAEAAIVEVSMPGITDGTVVPINTPFSDSVLGNRFLSTYEAEVESGTVALELQAVYPGSDSNLSVGDTLVLLSQIDGIAQSATATVTAVTNTGSDEENLEAYRERVLFRKRSVRGGGNSTNYKEWGEEVAGVKKVYPYAGKPDESPPSNPGDRTVYVEVTTTIHPDGVAPQSILDEVRNYINVDPDTGRGRPPLGMTDETLYVESIYRSSFTVNVIGLVVPDESETAAKEDITVFVGLYFLYVAPFVESFDPIKSRKDTITKLTVGKIVQEVLSSYGGYASDIEFGLYGGSTIDSYTLAPNELAKLHGVTYE